ncbi:hypothetical protein [Nocardioides sp.]|uniref:hypothetical protein n=1 Tax=Nocardioides sp. TaxID=35761 RepID=UPI002ED5F990
MAMIVQAVLVQAAEESHNEVSSALSYGVGIGILALLLALMGALVAFGGGREHS